MSTYIKNYGITKTIIQDNHHKIDNQIKWFGDYDGNMANIQLDIDDNGSKEFVSMKLDNNDLMKLLGIQSIELPLEQRLSRDFLDKPYKPIPINLEGALIRKKTRKHRSRRHHKKNVKSKRKSL